MCGFAPLPVPPSDEGALHADASKQQTKRDFRKIEFPKNLVCKKLWRIATLAILHNFFDGSFSGINPKIAFRDSLLTVLRTLH